MRLFLVFSLRFIRLIWCLPVCDTTKTTTLNLLAVSIIVGDQRNDGACPSSSFQGEKKKEKFLVTYFFLTLKLQGTLHIPRPVLTVIQVPEEESSVHNSMSLPPTPPSSTSSSNELTMSVTGSFGYDRCDTPTRFTLLGESGVIVRTHRTTPTTCQLSMTFCTLALLALVGMIVYMEGKVLI